MLVYGVLQLAMSGMVRAAETIEPPVLRNAERIGDVGLRAAVADYYWHERKREWAVTYAYRRETFHDTVPFDVYVREMQEDSVGVDLRELEILGLAETISPWVGPSVEIMIRFFEWHENATTFECEFGSTHPCPKGLLISEPVFATVWIHGDGNWKCLDCGRWTTYSLNQRWVMSE